MMILINKYVDVLYKELPSGIMWIMWFNTILSDQNMWHYITTCVGQYNMALQNISWVMKFKVSAIVRYCCNDDIITGQVK